MVNMKSWFIGLHLLVGLSFIHASDEKINYRSNDQYEEIWNDSGSTSSATHNVSIWRLTHLHSGYCSLGDVASKGYHHPDIKSISVSTSSPDAAHPIMFTHIWNDTGTGSRLKCAIYKMKAPAGFTCLGSVAMRSYDVQPDPNKYCCIRDDLIIAASFKGIYFGIDLSMWTVEKIAGSHGIAGNNFIAVKGHIPPGARSPPIQAYLLNGEKATKASDEKINYRSNDQYEEIWNDSGSKSVEDHRVSIWRLTHLHSGYCSLGDVASKGYHHPDIKSISVSTSSPDVAHPTMFTQIWNDTGTGSRLKCALYDMSAPPGFTCLGSVAMRSYDVQPDPNNYCCIRDDFRVAANVQGIYFGKWKTTDKDLSLWTIVKKGTGLGITGNNFMTLLGYLPPGSRTPPIYTYLLNGQKATKVGT